MILTSGVRTVCGSHTPHTPHILTKALNYGNSWRRKPQERTQQNAHGIKLRVIVTGGVEWPKSWPKNLDGNGGGDSVQKPVTTAQVLNGVFGGGKQDFS